MARTCIFCGSSGRLTAEHVFGDWLTRIGLDVGPVAHLTGPLNRIGRDMGVTLPFRRTVRDVCGQCNSGWMSRLEQVAQGVLTPFILSEPGTVERQDQGAIAAWLQKTALVAMFVCSEDDRARGYGLPVSEYRALCDRRAAVEPLSATHMWIGQYEGGRRLASVWVTPLVAVVDSGQARGRPDGYAMTLVLGQLLLHGVRLTKPGLDVQPVTESSLLRLWPAWGCIDWPGCAVVDDASFLRLSGGKELRTSDPGVGLRPWKPAVDLPDSRGVGSMVELPVACGQHVVYYPGVLVEEASRGRLCVFMTACECGQAYLIQTKTDGAHCKASDTPEAMDVLYESLPGEELMIEDDGGMFVGKWIPGGASDSRTGLA